MEGAVGTLRKKPLQNLLSILIVVFHWSTGSVTAYIIALSLGWRAPRIPSSIFDPTRKESDRRTK